MSEEAVKQEVIYTKAKLGRRMLAHIIDIGIFALLAITLFTLFHSTMRYSSYYSQKYDTLQVLRDESGLFVGDQYVTEYIKDSKKYPTYTDKKDELAKRLQKFYTSKTYFGDSTKGLEGYQSRQLKATYKGTNLFIENEEHKIVENGLAPVRYYNYYSNEIEDRALAYMLNNKTYYYLVRFTFLSALVEAIIAVFLSYTVFYFILPATCFKLGRQTIGMKLEKIGLISIRADNITFGVFTLRSLFNFFVFIPLNIVGFLLPSIISTTMMFVNKTNSSLPNYVFNDYMVDISNQEIYYNEFERQYAQEHIHEASIENKDFKLK